MAGIGRRRRGKSFVYVDAAGRRVTDDATLRRIRSLAIPPAWTDVWISPIARGYLQATGRDARGRKQYRYHPEFRQRRDAGKYDRLMLFGEGLPRLRRRVARDLGKRGLPRDKVLAAVVQLLERTAFRVGNEEYARLNKSFGLSTLRKRHARVASGRIRFRFRGKAGKVQEVDVDDRRLARIVRRIQELPGQALFEYVDDEDSLATGETPEAHPIDSDDVNEYIREAMGSDFSAKDLRTWAGTMHAFRALQRAGSEAEQLGESAAEAAPTDPRRIVLEAIKQTAAALGNTPAVARASYVHPGVLEAYLEGARDSRGPGRASRSVTARTPAPGSREEELALLRLLRRRKAASERAA